MYFHISEIKIQKCLLKKVTKGVKMSEVCEKDSFSMKRSSNYLTTIFIYSCICNNINRFKYNKQYL